MKWLSKLRSPTAPLTTGDSGRLAQSFAEQRLKSACYRIVARNLSDKHGELDLVLAHKAFDGVIVAEVRSYSETTPLRQEEVLPKSKQKQVVESAHRLLPKLRGVKKGSLRFDAVLVSLDASGKPKDMTHIENAFTTTRGDWFV